MFYPNLKVIIMQELTLNEMQEVNGGLLPIIGALIAIDILIWTAVALK